MRPNFRLGDQSDGTRKTARSYSLSPACQFCTSVDEPATPASPTGMGSRKRCPPRLVEKRSTRMMTPVAHPEKTPLLVR
jgi:hypothetical protein